LTITIAFPILFSISILFRTLSNPSDHPEVIGVGSLAPSGQEVARYSSRGPTLWELAWGAGRVKPDLLAEGHWTSTARKSANDLLA